MANTLIPETNVCPSKELATCGVKMLFTNGNVLFFFRNTIEREKDTKRERQRGGRGKIEGNKEKEGRNGEGEEKKERGKEEGRKEEGRKEL